VYCGICGHKLVVQYKGGNQDLCTYLRAQTQAPVCQRLPAAPLDQHAVTAFFQALAPVELDRYAPAMQQRRQQRDAVDRAHQLPLQRLRYEAELARRRYERVDPDNRLVADELERRWETALQAWQEAEAQVDRHPQWPDTSMPCAIPQTLRTAFTSLGEAWPPMWQQDTLSRAQRKARLRCLIDKVVLHRMTLDTIQTRMVWRGGAVSELAVPSSVGTLRDLRRFTELEAQLLTRETQGKSDEEMAQLRTAQGVRSPQRPRVLPSTVQTIRLQHGRLHRYRGPRPRHVPGWLPVSQLAPALGVKPYWVYHLIRRGPIRVTRHPATRLYLLPHSPDMLEDCRRLQPRHITPLRV
jgi:hypothetical protein